MNLFRPLHTVYELVTSSKLDRAFKNAWNVVSILIWSLLRDGSNNFTEGFISQACEPHAVAGSPEVELQTGLAVKFMSSRGAKFESKVRPIFLAEPQVVEFTTNNDISGDDRIDSVFIRPIETDEDTQKTWIKDPTQGQAEKTDLDQIRRYGWETEVVEGSVAANPSAPSEPAGDGWMRIADVLRPNGQQNVTSSDITDQRTVAPFRLGKIESLENLSVIDTITAATVEATSLLTTPEIQPDSGSIINIRDEFGQNQAILDLAVIDTEDLNAASSVASDIIEPLTLNAREVDFRQEGNSNPGTGDVLARDVHARNTLKAWGTVDNDADAFHDQVGLSSVVRQSPGHYTVTLSEAASANQNIATAVSAMNILNNEPVIAAALPQSTTDIDVHLADFNGNDADVDFQILVAYK